MSNIVSDKTNNSKGVKSLTMYIRQQTLFSFEEILKFQKETQLELIFSKLDLSKIANKLGKSSYSRGPKGYCVMDLLYAKIAMQIERIPTVKDLVKKLRENPVLRYNCGFEVLGNVPSESTFSRFMDKLSESDELATLFREVVIQAKNLDIIDGRNTSLDSSKLSSYEASVPKSKITDDGTNPNWGMKRDTNGNNIRWFGWKIHVLCDSKSELPLEILVTPANVYDGTQALPLIENLKAQYGEFFKPKYYAMDSAYDFEANYRRIIEDHKGSPIIAYNPRGSKTPPEGMNDRFQPICSAGYPLTYYGVDGDCLKFRCPHVTGHCDCPFGSSWCSSSNYGYTTKINWKQNPRHYGYPHRGSENWQKLYNTRTSVERMFSRMKDYLNLDNIRSKGIRKAKAYVLLNCIALIAGTIAVN